MGKRDFPGRTLLSLMCVWVLYLVGEIRFLKSHKRKKKKKKKSLLLKKGGRGDLNRYPTQEDIWKANKHLKRCSASSVIREMQIELTLQYHCTRMARTRKTNHTQC